MSDGAERIFIRVDLLIDLLSVVLLVDALFAAGVLRDDAAPCIRRLRLLVVAVLAAVEPLAGRQSGVPASPSSE